MKIPELKLSRAKELITTSKHIALATVNSDGTPHNSPVRFYVDEKLETQPTRRRNCHPHPERREVWRRACQPWNATEADRRSFGPGPPPCRHRMLPRRSLDPPTWARPIRADLKHHSARSSVQSVAHPRTVLLIATASKRRRSV